MKISIITATYNSATTIKDTLLSVANQTYTNIEHIIIDGSSEDNTLDIVSEFPHVNKIISEPDKGIYDAMNKGIKVATGEIIGILNSDDLLYSNSTIEIIAEAFKSQNISATYGNIIFFDTVNPEKITRFWKAKNYYPAFFENGELPPHPTLYVRKNVYENIGFYKLDYKIAADVEFMLRMLKIYNYKSYYINEIIVKMRNGGASTNGLKSFWIISKETKRLWKENGLKFPFRLYFSRPYRRIIQLFNK